MTKHVDPRRLGHLAERERIRARIERRIEKLIAKLDSMDGNPDDEPSLGSPELQPINYGWGSEYSRSQEHWARGGDVGECEDVSEDEGAFDDHERSLGWSAVHSQAQLGDNTEDGDETAPERYGAGFVRGARDDSEDGHDQEAVCEDEGAEHDGCEPDVDQEPEDWLGGYHDRETRRFCQRNVKEAAATARRAVRVFQYRKRAGGAR